jgi:integrase
VFSLSSLVAPFAHPHSHTTLDQLTDDWAVAQRPRLRASHIAEVQRLIGKLPADLREKRAARVGKRDVSGVLQSLAPKPGTQRVTLNALRTVFKWGMQTGRLDANPCAGLSAQPCGKRDRVLSEPELAAVWHASLSAKCPEDYGRILRLLILTGCRRDEIGSLEWSEVDTERAQLTLPGVRTKNRKAHIVPLAPLALAQLPPRPTGSGKEEKHVFGMRSGRPYSGWSKSKTDFDTLLGGLAPWVVHDLRRSFVTNVAERGLALPHVIEAVVNHQSGAKGGVAGIYNRAQYLPERRACLEAWADAFAKIVSPTP